MKTFTNADIRSWKPCYDPSLKNRIETKQHTIVSVLENKSLHLNDRIWVIMRRQLVSDEFMRIFATKCARLSIDNNTDPRLVRAIEIAEGVGADVLNKSELVRARNILRTMPWSPSREIIECALEPKEASAARLVVRALTSPRYHDFLATPDSSIEKILMQMIILKNSEIGQRYE